MPTRLTTFLAGLLLLSSATAADAAQLEFEGGWSPEAPPGRMMAGYVTIRNVSNRDITLVGGESEQFQEVEIHTMSMDEGVMRMRRLDELVVEASGSVELAPRGLHLMLIGPKSSLTAGDRIEITLRDDAGDTHALWLKVRSR